MVGLVSYGAYIPRYRLDRKKIFEAMGWMASGNIALSKGTKAVASFDEDSITMAVAASLKAVGDIDKTQLDTVNFASTCMPFKERLNSGIIKAALGLKDQVNTADFSSGIKAGTTALLNSIDSVSSGRVKKALICSSDTRLGKPASPQEMIFGDGAAAMVIGDENVIAEYKGSYCTAHDFVDHYRGEYAKFDRQWEDRWIRDMGLLTLIPDAVNGFLKSQQMKISDFSKVIYPCHYAAARKQLNKTLGISPEMEEDHLQADIGETGTPHSLLMLAKSLETAKPGDHILLICFGSGCDVIHFQVTENILKLSNRNQVSEALKNCASLDNYTKYLVWRDIIPVEKGMRSEEDLWTRWSALWRKRKEVFGLIGSKCTQCDTAQYPPQRICVNPQCGAVDEMEDYSYSDKIGRIASFTGDNLAASPNPPAIYGQIEFDGGGKYMFDIADCDLESVKVQMPVTMSFRRKYHDQKREISGYFWKAVPTKEEN